MDYLSSSHERNSAGVTDPIDPTPFLGAAKDLFQFFRENVKLRIKEFTSTDQYESTGRVIWLADLPQGPAVHSALQRDDLTYDDEVLVVERVDRIDPPEVPRNVGPWLYNFSPRNPDMSPELLPKREVLVADPGDEQAGGEKADRSAGDLRTLVDVLRLSDFPDVEPAYDKWRPQWSEWAAEERRRRPVRDLY